jgi:tRNA threonylcarbamoyladenosine biosynthesis protein TsaB
MGEIYLGAYACEEAGARVLADDGLFHPDTLPALPEKDWMIVGSGLVYGEALRKAYGASRCEADVHPHAKAVAQLALSGFQRGEGVSAEQAQPVYLRDQVIQGAVR